MRPSDFPIDEQFRVPGCAFLEEDGVHLRSYPDVRGIRTPLYHGQVTRNMEVAGAKVSRRELLAAIAAAPAILAVGEAADASFLTSELSVPLADAGGVATGKIKRGGARRFNAPWLAPGARLRLPEGLTALPVEGFFENQPHAARTAYAWPYIPDAGGAMVDAAIVPDRGSASRMAILSGFEGEGWYELIHANGKVDRFVWNAQKLPFLWYWGEFGGSKERLFMDKFYTLGLEAFSRPPIS